jgi:hypothetical protein
VAALRCPSCGTRYADAVEMCPSCVEFLVPGEPEPAPEPEPTAPLPAMPAPRTCPEPGCGTALAPDGRCPVHALDALSAEASAYAPPPGAATGAATGEFVLEFPWGAVPIGPGETLVGRSPDAGALAGPLRPYDNVSRRHALVYREGGALYVRDLGSTNGTYVNERQVAEHSPVRVREGDVVRFAANLTARVRERPR